ncbi:MAG: hypothetical protein U0790_00030 [Isosphaeraceae bacterium]
MISWRRSCPVCRADAAPATARKMHQVLGHFAELSGVDSTEGIGPRSVARFVEAKADCRPETVRGYLSYLSPAFRLASEDGPLRAQSLDLRGPSDWIPAPEVDDEEEDDRGNRGRPVPHRGRGGPAAGLDGGGRSTGPGRLHALASFLLYTGVRRNEALLRKVRDVDCGARIVQIRSRRRARLKKRSAAAPVPMPPALVEVMATWIPMAGDDWLFPGLRGRGPWTGGTIEGRPIGQLARPAWRRASGPSRSGCCATRTPRTPRRGAWAN